MPEVESYNEVLFHPFMSIVVFSYQLFGKTKENKPNRCVIQSTDLGVIDGPWCVEANAVTIDKKLHIGANKEIELTPLCHCYISAEEKPTDPTI